MQFADFTHVGCSKLLAILTIYSVINLHQTEQTGAQMTLSPVSTCGPQFPSVCICGREMYENQLRYIVNCTNTGLHNTNVLEFMPAEVEVLIFTGNKIPELPWNVFGSINDYKQLRIVDMSNNHIREIRGKSYHHVQNVERLILNHNNLSISRDDEEVNHHHPRVFSNFLNLQSLHLTDAFDDNASPELSEDLHDIFIGSQLKKLQKLHLEQNEITRFKDRRVFCDLPSLQDLHLGDNYLTEINFDLHCLTNLRFLDLERNKFQFVKAHDMVLIDELSSRVNRTIIVDFNLNPFVCDCEISSFYTWMRSTKVSVRNKDAVMCYENKTHALPILELNMSKCSSAIAAAAVMFNTASGGNYNAHYGGEMAHSRSAGHTATLVFLLVVLSIILVGLIGTLVYISRDKIKCMITPVFDNVTKKVHYTSIKDDDCPEVHV